MANEDTRVWILTRLVGGTKTPAKRLFKRGDFVYAQTLDEDIPLYAFRLTPQLFDMIKEFWEVCYE
jgi:hypothetical protein